MAADRRAGIRRFGDIHRASETPIAGAASVARNEASSVDYSLVRCAPPTRATGRTKLPPPCLNDAGKMQICHKAFGPWKLCVRLVQDVPESGKRLASMGLFVSQQRSHVAIPTTLPSTTAASRLQHVCWSGIHATLSRRSPPISLDSDALSPDYQVIVRDSPVNRADYFPKEAEFIRVVSNYPGIRCIEIVNSIHRIAQSTHDDRHPQDSGQ